MKIKRFFGKDMRDALNQVKEELGGDAVIMSNKKLADGVELVAAYDKEPTKAVKAPIKRGDPDPARPPVTPQPAKRSPSLSEIIGDSGPDSLRELLEKQAKQHSIEPEPAPDTSPKPEYTPSSATNQRMEEMFQELKSLRHVLEFQVSDLVRKESRRGHPLKSYLTARLEQMGIQTELAEEVVSYAPEEVDERQAWLFLLKLLANRLLTTGDEILNQSGVVALVGPTGTGKTTTIAKLAAKYAQKYGPDQVAMITIDTYRIAAFEQLATYGRIIGCAVKKATDAQALSDLLYQLRNKRLVLIDTAGFGQRDGRLINQLETLQQQASVNIKKYLVMQANAQYQVTERTISAYKAISLQGCIFTKLDECYSLGEAVSAAIAHRLPVGYVTDGQRVPEDIKVADGKYLISTAAKLYKQYGLTHTDASMTHTAAAAL